MTAQTLHVSGMHCAACVTLIEDVLGEHPHVGGASASLSGNKVHIGGPIAQSPADEIAVALNPLLAPYGYALSVTPPRKKVAWRQFLIAVPIALAFLGFYFWLQKQGIVNLASFDGMSLISVFIIGVIASLSTCMAVVGGLTLSVAANFSKGGDKVTPQVLFHVGRLVSFVVLGGVIGALGAQFEFGATGSLVLNLIVGLVMLILGINLLDVMPFFQRLQPTLPSSISRRLLTVKALNHSVTPALLGAVTFFLPCGFTQSMQVYALTTGSFAAGALTMGVFALGTLPVLGLLSFASSGLKSPKASGIFYKASGLVVIGFGAITLLTGLAAAGYIPPIVRF